VSFYHSSVRDPLITLLIDEELHSRQRISRLLREIAPEFTGIAEACTESEAIKKIERFTPNLIFSICPSTPRLSDVFSKGVAQHVPKVIVCKEPNSIQQSIENFGGFFLKKPVDAQHLRDLLDALGNLRRNGNGSTSNNNHIPGNGQSNGQSNGEPNGSHANGKACLSRLVVRKQGRFRLLPVDKVVWFGTEFRLVYAYTDNRRYPIDLGLDQLEMRLDPNHFVRIHRSAIVNVRRIDHVMPISGGRSKVLLNDKEKRTLPLSASRAKFLKELILLSEAHL